LAGHGHRDRQVQAPVGRVGGVRDQRIWIEQDIGLANDRPQRGNDALALGRCLRHLALDGCQQPAAGADHLAHQSLAARIGFDDAEIRLQVAHETATALSVVNQFLVQVGVAPVDENLAEETHEQARRAPGHPAFAQYFQLAPDSLAEQLRNRLPVVGRRVVERDLAWGFWGCRVHAQFDVYSMASASAEPSREKTREACAGQRPSNRVSVGVIAREKCG
jgi:hypothetical protein